MLNYLKNIEIINGFLRQNTKIMGFMILGYNLVFERLIENKNQEYDFLVNDKIK